MTNGRYGRGEACTVCTRKADQISGARYVRADVDEGKIWENIPGPHGSGANEALNRKFCESASGSLRKNLK